MLEYLALIQGATTIELTDTTNYALVSYAPAVAPLRDNELGGEGSYQDVQETVTIHALGCTAAEAYQAAEAIEDMLDQARRWWKEQNVSPVLLQVQAQGSAFDSLRAVVKGRAPGGPPSLALPAVWSAHYGKYVIENISIQFVRRGPLVRPNSESISIAASNPSATVVSANFATNDPTACYLSLTANNIIRRVDRLATPYLLWHKTAINLQIIEAEAIPTSGAPQFTTVADAVSQARGGLILRFSGSGSLDAFIQRNPLVITTSCKRAMIFAAVRSNSNAVTWGIRVRCLSKSGANANNDPSDATTFWRSSALANPEIIPIGIVSVRNGIGAINVLCSSPVVTTERLDIDYFVLLGIDDEQSGVLSFGTTDLFNVFTTAVTNLLAFDMLFDPTADTTANVRLRNTTISTFAGQSYSGDPIAQHSGQNLSVCFLACNSTFWRVYDSTGAALVNIGFNATRYLTDRIPR